MFQSRRLLLLMARTRLLAQQAHVPGSGGTLPAAAAVADSTTTGSSSISRSRLKQRSKRGKKVSSSPSPASFAAGTATTAKTRLNHGEIEQQLEEILQSVPTTSATHAAAAAVTKRHTSATISGGSNHQAKASDEDVSLSTAGNENRELKEIRGGGHAEAPHWMNAAELNRRQVVLERTVEVLPCGGTATAAAVGGASYAAMERIERRRSKITVSDAEYEVGVTERLFPEIRRLPVLHEVHYGDALVREMDGDTHFHRLDSTHHDSDTASAAGIVAEDLDDAEFLSFENEMGEDDNTISGAHDQTAAATAKATSPSTPETTVAGTTTTTTTIPEPSTSLVTSSSSSSLPSDLEIPHGKERPWFLPEASDGVVRLQPLSVQDCALLLRFLLHLRGQHVSELPKPLQAKLADADEGVKEDASFSDTSGVLTATTATQKSNNSTNNKTMTKKNGKSGALSIASQRLTLRDVNAYLDTAPPPVLGFTEHLHPRDSLRSPAFVFTLYIENASLQNIFGHLAALFAIPQKSFRSHTAASKMSCATLLCAVERNRLTRQDLLLLNTMRHPGFVIRVSSIREVPENVCDAEVFGALARWQPLYETEMILRRIGASGTSGAFSKREVERRMRAVQEAGAVFFCANREASLARAATDVLHGFYRSAVINALQRRKAPLPLRQFLAKPNTATAQRAHRAATDPTVRHVLKTFIETNGDWHATVARAPYTWRRRWMNALRASVWNTMASRRLRRGADDGERRRVLIGDVVIRPEYRADAERRLLPTVKAEHVKLVETQEEADACSLEDVFIPFLRGRYPEHLFATESSAHPIMTRAGMLSLLRGVHAPQLLLGLPDEARVLLDIRSDVSPVLFRRLLMRPLALQFTILEDKVPVKSIHFDAARVLRSDRWLSTTPRDDKRHSNVTTSGRGSSNSKNGGEGREKSSSGLGGGDAAAAIFPTPSSNLLPQSEVLERTTIGARLSSGVLSEEFFDIPSRDDYVVLGRAKRYLEDGELIKAAPLTPEEHLGDRLYSLHIRAVCRNGVAGLTQMLREYFILSSIEQESDSALQHKVHRMRRELDPETALLTAESFCPACFNRDHDSVDVCAEYLFKKRRQEAQLERQSMLRTQQQQQRSLSSSLVDKDGASADGRARRLLKDGTAITSVTALRKHGGSETEKQATGGAAATTIPVRMVWHMRRTNDSVRWGVHLSKHLKLLGVADLGLIASVTLSPAGSAGGKMNSKLGGKQRGEDSSKDYVDWPRYIISAAKQQHHSEDISDEKTTPIDLSPEVASLASCLAHMYAADSNRVEGAAVEAATVVEMHAKDEALDMSKVLNQWCNKSAGSTLAKEATTTTTTTLLQQCGWKLTEVNDEQVHSRHDVANAFVKYIRQTAVTLVFEMKVPSSILSSSSSSSPTDAQQVEEDAASGGTGGATQQQQRLQLQTTEDKEKKALVAHIAASSTETQRWLHGLPATLHLVLTKQQQQQVHSASGSSSSITRQAWGIRIDGADMTLVNLGDLLARYMETSSSSSSNSTTSTHAYVSSVAPRAYFPRGSATPLARGLLADLKQHLIPLLSSMYVVTRVNGKHVTSKEDTAAVMADFQKRVMESGILTSNGSGAGGVDAGSGGRVAGGEQQRVYIQLHLPLVLERKKESFALALIGLSQASAAKIENGEEDGEGVNGGRALVEDGIQRRGQDISKGLGHFSLAESSPATTAGTPDLQQHPHQHPTTLHADVVCSPTQCYLLSKVKQKQSTVTIAINRCVLNERTRGKWGIRIQKGTTRLKSIAKDRNFTFQVFASKRQQAVRISDTLTHHQLTRFLAKQQHEKQMRSVAKEERGGTAQEGGVLSTLEDTEEGTVTATAAMHSGSVAGTPFFSHHAYIITAVNQIRVSAHPQLLQALASAAATAATWEDGIGSLNNTAAALPESVTLAVQQFALARLSIQVKRGGLGEASALSSVGLRVDRDMCIVAVSAGSPMARGIEEATAEACSLRSLISSSSSSLPTAIDDTEEGDGNDKAATQRTSLNNHTTALSSVPVLGDVLNRLADLVTPASSASGTGAAALRAHRSWRYNVDDDDHGGGGSGGSTATSSSSSGADHANAERSLYKELERQATELIEEFSVCNVVDAVPLLQTLLVREFALASLIKMDAEAREKVLEVGQESGGGGGSSESLDNLYAQLARVKSQVHWRVMYAKNAHQTLRTAADLASALAPGVAEETVVVQQCLIE